MRRQSRQLVKRPRSSTASLLILDPCREGEHGDCVTEVRQAGQRFVCCCGCHVEAGTVDPKDYGVKEVAHA